MHVRMFAWRDRERNRLEEGAEGPIRFDLGGDVGAGNVVAWQGACLLGPFLEEVLELVGLCSEDRLQARQGSREDKSRRCRLSNSLAKDHPQYDAS